MLRRVYWRSPWDRLFVTLSKGKRFVPFVEFSEKTQIHHYIFQGLTPRVLFGTIVSISRLGSAYFWIKFFRLTSLMNKRTLNRNLLPKITFIFPTPTIPTLNSTPLPGAHIFASNSKKDFATPIFQVPTIPTLSRGRCQRFPYFLACKEPPPHQYPMFPNSLLYVTSLFMIIPYVPYDISHMTCQWDKSLKSRYLLVLRVGRIASDIK